MRRGSCCSFLRLGFPYISNLLHPTVKSQLQDGEDLCPLNMFLSFPNKYNPHGSLIKNIVITLTHLKKASIFESSVMERQISNPAKSQMENTIFIVTHFSHSIKLSLSYLYLFFNCECFKFQIFQTQAVKLKCQGAREEGTV